MAVHEEGVMAMGKSHTKGLDAGAINMILDNLQRSQYQFPIASTTRELACNGLDSVREKIMAKAILTGTAKVEDYFVEKEGELYKDSHWNPEYYDLKWLSNNDTVEIRYIVGASLGKDRIEFRDNGVGLGGKRLIGYFSLGFSTKRLNKLPLGKFGIGAKAPLSTDVEFYTMETRYNGQRFKFNIYNSTVDSIIPRFNLSNGTENEYILFNAGTEDEYKVYWEPTDLLNGVTVSLETKKHHKQQYIDAVQRQLLYFDNIRFVIQENSTETEIPYKANILFQDETIVLSDNNYWSKPHILLNGVNYGYIAWDELELEDKTGNIGIKVDPSEVEVNPSRESLRWSEITKNKIIERFNNVVEIATKLLQEELSSSDFIQWLRTCYTISSRNSNRQDIIGRLAKVADLSQVKPRFKGDDRVRFGYDLLNGLYMRIVTFDKQQRNNVYRKVVDRKEVTSYSLNDIQMPIFLMEKDERASNRKDKFLLTMYEKFLVIYAPFETIEKMQEAGISEDFINRYQKILAARRDSGYASTTIIFDLIKQSSVPIVYANVEVPEDFTGTEEEIEEKQADTKEEVLEEKEMAKVAKQTAEERRKLEGKILVYTPKCEPYFDTNLGITRHYQMEKIEIPIKSINDWQAQEVYYGTEADDELIHLVAMLTRDRHPANELGKRGRRFYSENNIQWREKKWWRLNSDPTKATQDGKTLTTAIGNVPHYTAFYCHHFFDANDCILVKTSKANTKYVRDFLPVSQFFMRIKNNKITMSNLLIKWNTARIIRKRLHEVAFLYNFEQFNQEYSERYQKLRDYIDEHWRDVEPKGANYYGLNETIYSDMVNHLDTVQQFQDFVRKNPNDVSTIAAMAQALFGNPHLQGGMSVEPEIIQQLEELLDYGTAVGLMLNYMPILTGGGVFPSPYKPGDNSAAAGSVMKMQVPFELEQDIKAYLSYKGVLNYAGNKDVQAVDDTPEDTTLVVEDNDAGNGDEVAPEDSKIHDGVSMVV